MDVLYNSYQTTLLLLGIQVYQNVSDYVRKHEVMCCVKNISLTFSVSSLLSETALSFVPMMRNRAASIVKTPCATAAIAESGKNNEHKSLASTRDHIHLSISR
jgi:hypothetical protein